LGAYVTGDVQSNPGVGVTVKHFFANSQENNQNAENNVISERTAREIDLKIFEQVRHIRIPIQKQRVLCWHRDRHSLILDI